MHLPPAALVASSGPSARARMHFPHRQDFRSDLSANHMFLDDARETMRQEPLERRKRRGLRVPQILPVALICLLYALSLYVFFRHGFIDAPTFGSAAVAVLVVVLTFQLVFQNGWNLHFEDPTLMLPQLLASLLLMLGVAWLERDTQIALVPFMLIAFSFGIFRLSTASLAVLAAGSLGAYLSLILLRAYIEGYGDEFRADLVQWCVLALTLPGLILLAKQIQNLRQLLRSTRSELQHYEEKAARDELTGLYNRRQLQTELDQAKLRADHQGASFALCLIDVDHFKEINDTHGHLAGDTILREFARLSRESIRDSDILGRYGGDEFMQILPDTDVKGAVMHAERLRIYAHFLDFENIPGQKKISLSIGVAQYRPGERLNDLISRADSALYQAKQLGRNRVEWTD
jgi:diguanylate cyclase (GGDEF)-like protein